MSENDPELFDRRRLLKAAGVALGVATVGAGSATADHIRIGECARVIYDVQAYETCQMNDGPIVEGGTQGTIMDRCENNSLVFFVPEARFDQEEAWLDDSYLEKC